MEYGKWTILHKIDGRKCMAKCSCGLIKEAWTNNIVSGKSKQCVECQAVDAKKRTIIPNFTTNREPIYNVYQGIKRRCYNKNQKSYKHYGAKGVKLCPEWLNDFKKFYEWAMSNGYKTGMAISRKNDIGDYSPDNCVIKTFSENSKEVVAPSQTLEQRRQSSQSRTSLSDENIIELIAMAQSNLFSNKELAEKFCIDRHTVTDICSLWGVEPRYKTGYLSIETISKVRELKASGLTYNEIKNITGLSVDTLYKIVKRRKAYKNI